MNIYYIKYLKYKNKYLNLVSLRNQKGGNLTVGDRVKILNPKLEGEIKDFFYDFNIDGSVRRLKHSEWIEDVELKTKLPDKKYCLVTLNDEKEELFDAEIIKKINESDEDLKIGDKVKVLKLEGIIHSIILNRITEHIIKVKIGNIGIIDYKQDEIKKLFKLSLDAASWEPDAIVKTRAIPVSNPPGPTQSVKSIKDKIEYIEYNQDYKTYVDSIKQDIVNVKKIIKQGSPRDYPYTVAQLSEFNFLPLPDKDFYNKKLDDMLANFMFPLKSNLQAVQKGILENLKVKPTLQLYNDIDLIMKTILEYDYNGLLDIDLNPKFLPLDPVTIDFDNVLLKCSFNPLYVFDDFSDHKGNSINKYLRWYVEDYPNVSLNTKGRTFNWLKKSKKELAFIFKYDLHIKYKDRDVIFKKIYDQSNSQVFYTLTDFNLLGLTYLMCATNKKGQPYNSAIPGQPIGFLKMDCLSKTVTTIETIELKISLINDIAQEITFKERVGAGAYPYKFTIHGAYEKSNTKPPGYRTSIRSTDSNTVNEYVLTFERDVENNFIIHNNVNVNSALHYGIINDGYEDCYIYKIIKIKDDWYGYYQSSSYTNTSKNKININGKNIQPGGSYLGKSRIISINLGKIEPPPIILTGNKKFNTIKRNNDRLTTTLGALSRIDNIGNFITDILIELNISDKVMKKFILYTGFFN